MKLFFACLQACVIAVLGFEDGPIDPEMNQLNYEIDIQGVPRLKYENLTAIVVQLARILQIENTNRIVSIERKINNRTLDFRHDSIILKLPSLFDKMEWVRAGRRIHYLTAQQIDPQYEPKIVSINENLPGYVRRLLVECKKFAKRWGFRFVWTKHGVIYLRKQEGHPYLRVGSYNGLLKLEKYELDRQHAHVPALD